MDVQNPFDGSVIDTVPRASVEDVDAAVASAVRGAAAMAKPPRPTRGAGKWSAEIPG